MAEFSTLADISVASVKTYLDIDSTNTDYDALITAHLLGARAFIEAYCRHDFKSIARVNYKPYIFKKTSQFYLEYWPVASITSITENGNTLTEDTDFYCDKNTGMVEKIESTDIINPTRYENVYWTTDRNAVVVNYVAGHALTDDVIMVVKEIVGIRAGLKKRTYTDNEGVERAATINSIPKEMLDILDRHKQRRRIL